jgi:hypothetical protein
MKIKKITPKNVIINCKNPRKRFFQLIAQTKNLPKKLIGFVIKISVNADKTMIPIVSFKVLLLVCGLGLQVLDSGQMVNGIIIVEQL